VSDAPANEILFTYGALRAPQVQLDTFGHLVEGEDDVLPGYTVDYVDIEDAHTATPKPQPVHAIVRRTGDPRDKVVGCAIHLTEDELDAADEYQVESYHRERVHLASGVDAWVFVTQVIDRTPRAE
jgi:hypothetical protein